MARKKTSESLSQEYRYILDYINEAVDARSGLKAYIERAVNAYKKNPQVQIYKQNAYEWYKAISASNAYDKAKCDMLRSNCDSIPEGHNDTIFNAVETVVSMAMGGAGQFECAPVDRWLEKDEELIDRQELYLDFAYRNNNLDSIAPEAVRKLFMQGQINYHIKPIDNKPGEYKISLIDAYKMLLDPRRSKTNRERFIGYTEYDHFSSLKSYLYKDGKDYKLSVLNDVDKYLDELNNWGNGKPGIFTDEITEDLNTFRSLYSLPIHTSKSVDKDGKEVNPIDNEGYKGDDIEVAYLWDLETKKYFVVVNRRFIVLVKDNPMSQTIDLINYTYDENGAKEHKEKYTVEIDSPIVHCGLIDADWETFPITPLWYALDDFDILCAKEAIYEHNLSIMSPINFVASNYDSEIMSGMSQIAGQIIEGTSQTMGVLNKTHDLSPIIASIERSETRIKRMMGATDQYELAQLLNNRATGAEVSMANAAVSQRMNIALAKLEGLYRDLMTKILKMNVIFFDEQEYLFPYKDGVGLIKDSELVGTTITECRLKSRIKSEQKEQSQNALLIFQSLASMLQSGAVDAKRVFATFIPLISQGVISRRQAIALIDDSIKLTPEKLQAIIEQERQAKQAQENAGPLGGMETADIDTLNQLEAMVNQQGGTTAPQAMPTNTTADGMTQMPAGGDPTIQGMMANQVDPLESQANSEVQGLM